MERIKLERENRERAKKVKKYNEKKREKGLVMFILAKT